MSLCWCGVPRAVPQEPDNTMTRTHPYEFGLDKNHANFVALSSLSFIERSAGVYPEHIALQHAGLVRYARGHI